MDNVILIAATVLAGVLLILAPRTILRRAQRAPERPRPPWFRRDPILLEGLIIERISVGLDGLTRDDRLDELARRLALEALGDRPPTPAVVAIPQVCPSFGGETLERFGWIDDESFHDEPEMADALCEQLPTSHSGSHWGLGVAIAGRRATLMLLIGRLAWTWSQRPPISALPSRTFRADGEPTEARWAALSWRRPDGREVELELHWEENGTGWFTYTPEIGDLPGQLIAGLGGDRIEVATVDDVQ